MSPRRSAVMKSVDAVRSAALDGTEPVGTQPVRPGAHVCGPTADGEVGGRRPVRAATAFRWTDRGFAGGTGNADIEQVLLQAFELFGQRHLE